MGAASDRAAERWSPMSDRTPPADAGVPAADAAASSSGLLFRLVRLTTSLTAITAYVLLFAGATGATFALVGDGLETLAGTTWSAQVPLYGIGMLSLPAAGFLFLALYDDADLRRPTWPDGHPPLADAWLLVVLAVGVVVTVLPTAAWPTGLRLAGYAAAILGAGVGVPLWLARRCLRRPSWVLGGLAVLLGPVLAVAAFAGLTALRQEPPFVALAVAAAGGVPPYWLARRSPGPDALAALGRLRNRDAG